MVAAGCGKEQHTAPAAAPLPLLAPAMPPAATSCPQESEDEEGDWEEEDEEDEEIEECWEALRSERRLPCGLLASQVSDLFFREITPEDYELLLLLDERVKKKTTLNRKKVDNLPNACPRQFLGETCTVCLLPFEASDRVAMLPCRHFYHRNCVAQWLLSRAVCPLCGAEVHAA